MPAITAPLPLFADIADGSPLDAGYVYIGTAGGNPETSPIAVYWDAAATQAAVQPLRTIGGYIARGGAPASVYVSAADYSITVRDKTRQLMLYQPSGVAADAGLSLTANLASSASATVGAGLVGFNGQRNYVLGTIGWELRANGVRPEWFGAVGDATTNDAVAYAAAIAFCQLTLRSLLHTAGATYALASNIPLDGSPITFIGEPYGALQQGSTRPACTLRWTGGATPMFTSTTSGWRFVSMAVENFGTATCFLFTNASQSMHFEDMSFVAGSGTTIFSRAIFASDLNGLGYSKWIRNIFLGAAPAFIDIDGNGSSNGVTQLEIAGGLFESNSTGSVTVVRLTDINVTTLVMRGATYNQQVNELCLVDTTASPRSTTIYSLVITESEIDTPASLAAYRRLKLTNVINAQITGNYWNGSGTETAMAELVNSTVSDFSGNYVRAVAGPFFNADTLSRVTPGVNFFDTSSTTGLINDSATGSGIIPLTYGATVTILGQRGTGTGPVTFSVDVTNGSGWTLSLAHPGIGSGGYFVRGQQVTVMVRNVSGGALGAITLAAGVFKLAGSAFPVPLNGFSRSVTMVWNGSALVEVSRTTSDVPN